MRVESRTHGLNLQAAPLEQPGPALHPSDLPNGPARRHGWCDAMHRKHHRRYQGRFTSLASLARSLTTLAAAALLLVLAVPLVTMPMPAQAQGNAQSATYTVTFTGKFTDDALASGVSVPSGEHFTTLIGAVHNGSVTFWSDGGTASAGIESMAEVGGTSNLKSEINAASSNALAVIEQSIAFGGTATATVDITLTTDHPRVTLLTMVAPSPDWFVGVSGLSLLDEQGDWLASRTVNLYPWDAGTEEGTEFSLSNPATSPQGVITSLRGMGKFSNEAIATLTFTRRSVNTAPSFTSATSFEVDENQTAAGTVVAADHDSGDEVAYTITGGGDASEFEIGETTGVLTFARPPNYESPADVASMDPLNDAENNEHIVTVTATGGTADRALTAEQTITVTVRNVEEAGTVSFSQVGAAIRAKLSDPDGGVNGASWQWARSLDRSTGWVNISSATSAVYTPSSDDQEKYLRATVSYDDGHGSGKQAQGVSTYEITPPKLLVSTLVSGLTIPWDLAFTPDGTMLFTERSGVLSSRLTDGTVQTVTAEFGDVFSSGENGLMGIVVDPDFSSNRRFYTCQAHTGPEIQVIAWTINAAYTTTTRVADPLVGGMPASSFRHGGCRLRFGPQGYLWIATGDAASGTVPQDLTSLGGKVLRVDASTGAGAPANPFASSPLIYTYGHRNPQGLALRPGTSQMWSVEHGPSVDDEINLLVAGRNYGWDPLPGYNESVSMTDLMKFPGAVEAKWSSGSPTLATSGGIFLEGDQWGVWEGRLALATLQDSKLRLFEFTPEGAFVSQVVVPELNGAFGRLRTPMMGPDGALYVTTSNGGGVDRILRIVKDEAVPVTLKLTPEAIGENGGVSTVTVSLERESNVVTTVTVSATAVSPAVSGDFSLSSNKTLTIGVGQSASTGTVTITANNNGVDAPNKTVMVTGTATNSEGLTGPSDVTLTIRDDDATPVITTAALILVAENETVVATLQATDEDDRTEDLVWDITGGVDQSEFTLTTGGELAFKAAKDYENPDDSDGDRDYAVRVRVSDGANPVEADFVVRLQDVDDTAPTVSKLEITSDPGTDRTYAAENEIRVTVTFSETVVVTRTPRMRLRVGSRNRTAGYLRGSGAAALVFSYEVALGDEDTDGVSIAAGRIDRNGGTIKDEADNDAVLDHEAVAPQAGHKVDGVRPAFLSAAVNAAALTLTYGEALDEGSRPAPGDFTVQVDGSGRSVSGVSVSGMVVTLTLASVVAHDETVTVSYSPGANPIRDVPGNDAEALSRKAVTNETPDTTSPTVSSVEIPSTPPDNRDTYAIGDVIEVTVTFDETVVVTRTPRMRLRVGSRNRTAGYLRGSGAAALVFSYEVALGDEDTDGVSIAAGRIGRRGGTIKDEADNDAVLDHEAVAPQAGHKVDGVRPAFLSAAVDGSSLTLTYGEALDGGSRPAPGDFTVEVGGTGRSVSAVSVSGSVVTLTLDPAVEHGATGIRVNYSPGTRPIRDAVGNDALALSNRSVTNTTGAPPSVTLQLMPTSISENGRSATVTARLSHTSGETTTVTVSATAVTPAVSGDFTLSMNKTLTIEAAQAASTGTVTITANNNGVDAPNKTVMVMGTATNSEGVTGPSDETLTITDDDATPVITTAALILVAENETVVATLLATDEDDRTEDLVWEITGGNDRTQFTLPGGARLAFTAAKDYEEPDDSNGDGDYEVTVQVSDGFNAVEVEFTVRLQDVDDTAPTVSRVAITSDPGTDRTYAVDDEIQVTVTFSETVEVTGTPQLRLELGGGRRTADYEGGSGTAALVFAYKVADGESDTDGMGIEADSLSGGSIRDEARNNAELDHDGLAADSGHKVDGVRPRLDASGGAVVDGTTLTLTYDEALDGGSRPVSGDFTVSGGDRARAVTGVRVNGSAVELTLDVGAEHGEAGILVSYTLGDNPIRDVPGNDAEALSREPVTNDTPDTTSPEVSNVAISSNPGSDQIYAARDGIEVTVTFDETVVVTRTPRMRLRVGSRNRTAGYLRGSGAAALVFSYEVALGDEDTDGVSIAAGRIDRNGGTIKDEADNDAVLDHEAVAPQAGHKVDGVRPAFLSAAVDGSSLTLTYGEALDGGSRPAPGDFTVEVGGTGRSVSAVSVSGSVVTLTLDPAVEHGATGIRVNYSPGTRPIRDAVGNDALALSNRSVTNTTGAPPSVTLQLMPTSISENGGSATVTARLSHTSGETTTVTVSATAVTPAVSGDFTLSMNKTLTIGAGQDASTGTVTITANNNGVDAPNKTVMVMGTASNSEGVTGPSDETLTITDDDATPVITTAALIPVAENETVVATLLATDEDDRTEDLEWEITGGNDRSQFTLPGGGRLAFTAAKDYEEPDDSNGDGDYEVTVQVSDGFNAVEVEFTVRLQDVDDTAPTVSRVAITSDPGTDRTYAVDDEIQVTVTFSETVEVTGTPQLRLELGGGRRTADYEGGSGTAALVFAYKVADGESDTDGMGIEAASLSGGTIRDEARNNAELDHDGLAADSGHKVDGVRPRLAASGGAVVDGTRLTLTYDEALDGGSRPVSGDFTVSGGDRARAVTGVRVNGSAVELTLDVGAEHGEAGIQVSYTPGANPIQDVPGNDAEALSREPVTNDTPDTTSPTVSSLAITSNPGGDQIYAAEDEIEVTVTFSETVVVTRTPRMRLRVGSRNRTAGYLRGSGAAALVFSYEVALGDEDTDGVSIAAGRIDRNGGTIKDEADNDAVLDHEAVAPQAGHKVDGVRPAFLSAAVDGSSLTLTYGEALDGGSRPAPGDFTVEVGGTGRSVSAVSVSGSVVTLTLDPAVEHGDTGIRVNYSPGTRPIRDAVGNDALALSNRSVTNTTGAPNTAPEITSPGSFDVPENQALVRRLAARDDDPGDEVTGWEIVGGADRFQFSVARDTGELSFQTAPDFEAPGDNEYEVTVEVRSGTGARELEAEQTFTVRVTDEREPPGIPEAPTFSGETAESMTVNWSEPENTGPPITDYDVQYQEGGGGFTDAQHEGPGLALTLSDLKAGTVYEVQVRARNDEGTSDWSESGEGMTVTPLTVQMTPSPPPPVEAPLTMRFSFSEEVRGFTRTDITTQQEPACTDSANNPISCNPTIAALQTTDNRIFTTTVTPRTERVAHNYTLTLTVPAGRVTSAAGNKPNEEAMLEVRVAPPGVTVPISSLGRTASPGNGQVTLRWNTPQNTGGSAIIRYEYRWAESGAEFGDWVSVGPAERAATVPNLTNGREYVFEVRGVNALGYGPVETASATPESGGGGGGGGGGGLPQPPRPPANNRPMADAGPDQTGVREGALVTLDGSGSSDPDDDPLKYRWNQYRGERVALSSRDVVNPTFTAPQELTADVVLNFRLLVTDPGGRFDTDTVEVTVTVTDEDNENPGKPLAPTVSAATPYSLMVEWMEPENSGPAITDYDVQYREGGSGDGFTDAQHQGTARTATLTGLMPDTVYEVQVRATNVTGTGDWSESGEGMTKTLQTGDQIYYFPHLAVGASWQTTITYINYSREEVACQTDFLSDHGSPLMVSFAELGTVDSRTDVLPPGGSVHQETNVDLNASLAPGWALANCSGPVQASLLFRWYNSEGMPVAEAGVNAATVPATRFVTFAERGEGQFGTGVAYANPSATSALVTFTARDTAGEVLASADRTLLPGGHDAHGMESLFGLSSFTGSIEVTSTEPIVSLSLNFEADPVFSSLPPGELDASAQGSTTYYFPHLAVGASWQTTITYINYSPEEVTCQTDFISDHGTPLMVSFAALGTVVSRTDVLPPGGSVHQETNVDLNVSLAPGWARATCSGPVKASLLYRLHNSEGAPTAEAGVNATAVPATRFVTFAEQGEGQFGTGVAYANPSAISVPVTFTARDAAGEVLASVVRTLSPGGHDAHGMSELFGLTSFTGSIEVTSTEPIVSLSLNFEAAPVFSSLPPGELEAAAQ